MPEPDRLVLLQHGSGADLDSTFTYPQFALMREQAKGAVDLFALSDGDRQLRSESVDRKVQVEFVSGDFFRILRVQPLLGRLLEPSDDDRGSASAMSAVISYRLWRTAFQSDASVIGRKILIDPVPFTVAGVTGRNFFGVEVGSYPDVWLSFASKPALSPQFKMLECKGCYWLMMMGRLNPGYGPATAQAGLNVIWTNVRRATIPESLPDRYSGLVLLALGLFGLISAICATRWRLSSTLPETSQSVAARSSLGRAALCGQLALSFSLLVAAILLARSLYDLRTFNAGFRRDHLLLISPDTSRARSAERDRVRYTEAVLSAIRNLPGVRSASASVVLPMSGSS